MARSPIGALANIRAQIKAGETFPPDECQMRVRMAYEVDSDGTPTAAAGWIRSKHRHPLASLADIPKHVPKGGLLRWSGGSSGAGHVCIYTGHEFDVLTTDYPTQGRWNRADVRDLARAWTALKFEGWDEEIDGVRVVEPKAAPKPKPEPKPVPHKPGPNVAAADTAAAKGRRYAKKHHDTERAGLWSRVRALLKRLGARP